LSKKNDCFVQLTTKANDMHHFWVDFGKSRFWPIFNFFIFLQKMIKKKNVFRFEYQSNVNFIMSSTRYCTPYLDKI